jgi:hypothetical protein
MLRLRERFAFRLRADHVADLAQHLNARRQEMAITIDDRGKLFFENKCRSILPDLGWRFASSSASPYDTYLSQFMAGKRYSAPHAAFATAVLTRGQRC